MTPESFGSFCNVLRSAAVGVALFACASAAMAQQVVVQTGNGGLMLEGRVLGYDGLHLRLMTEHGPLTLDYASVTCEGAACPDPEHDAPIVRFSGMARLGEVILPALSEGFARARGLGAEQFKLDEQSLAYVLRDAQGRAQLTLVYRATTTADGFADLLADEADVLMASRALSAAEVEMGQGAGLGRLDDLGQMRLLAMDAMVPVAAASQSVDSLSLADLARAMRGEVTSWAALGGPDIPLTVHMLEAQNGMADAFLRQILSGQLAEGAVRHATAAGMTEAMLQDRGALGVLAASETGNLHVLSLRDACGIAAVRRPETVRTEDYPLTYPMYLYQTRRYMPPLAEAFLDWMTSPEAQVILRRAGVQTQDPVPISVQQQGQRFAAAIAAAGEEVTLADLQEFVAFVQGKARLTLTFRFEEGAQEMDAPSMLHALYLATAIRDGRYQGQALTLVGFSDSEGGAFENRSLSLGRAEAVRDQVLAELGGALPEAVALRVAGWGEVLPIGCDDTPWGRRANRRVELWVAPLE